MDTFFNAIRKEISMIKGDTLGFNFQVQGLDGAEPTGIYFTCREKPESEDYYFNCFLGVGGGISQVDYDSNTDTATYSVRVAPEQTEELTVGRYYYNLQLDVNEDVLTLMRGRINIEWDVTRG